MKLVRNSHTGRRVLMNNVRDKRKSDFSKECSDECPFCPGRKDILEYCRYEEVVNGKWMVRAVDNKYPALICDEERHNNGEIDYGKHEVMIETPNHFKSFYKFGEEEFKYILKMYKSRFIDLESEKMVKSVIIYKNHLKNAGASKLHSHSQILSMSFIPPELEREIEMAKRGVFTREVNILLESENFISFIPMDSYLSGEIMIKNKKYSRFDKITIDEIEELSVTLKEVFKKICRVYGEIPFNVYLHSLPRKVDIKEYRWHLHIIPRKGKFGGFEFGTGLYINSLDVNEMYENFMSKE